MIVFPVKANTRNLAQFIAPRYTVRNWSITRFTKRLYCWAWSRDNRFKK